ncbi:MAG: RNA polymerase sigma factor [Gemmataceae bacterium]|nr:RNA polymerase sigma factor [Gemmataceae bacterium]
MKATLATHPALDARLAALLDPDVDLMLRVQRDEAGAFAELVHRHGGRLFARFYRSFQDRQDAEDLTQEVLLRLYRSRQRYQPRARFSTWLFHIAQNVARNALRSRRRQSSLRQINWDTAEESFPEKWAARSGSPSRPMECRELARLVRAALCELVGRQRKALEMFQFQNRSYREIASALDLSTKATKSLLYRARLQLRDAISRAEREE